MKDLLLNVPGKKFEKEFTTSYHLLFLINSKLLCHQQSNATI